MTNIIFSIFYFNATQLNAIMQSSFGCVGKTSIFKKLFKKQFDQAQKATIGTDFGSITKNIKTLQIKLQIWDTSGVERFRSLSFGYLRSCHVVFIVFDISNKSSFESFQRWIQFTKKQAKKDFQIYIIGNKSDLQQRMQVDKNTLNQKIQQLGFKYFQLSAKTGNNIQKMIEKVFQDVYEKSMKQNSKTINISVQKEKEKKTQAPSQFEKNIIASTAKSYFQLFTDRIKNSFKVLSNLEQKPNNKEKQKIEQNLPEKLAQNKLLIDKSLIYTIFCSNCKQQLSLKGNAIALKVNKDIKLFSSPFQTANIVQKGQQMESQRCQCKIKSLHCKVCNYQCGYHVIRLCKACRQSQINNKMCMFSTQKIKAKIYQQGQIKPLQKLLEVQINSFQEELSKNGISDLTMEIIKNEQIKSFEQLALIDDELLKQIGLKLGQIARLRKLQKIKYQIK